MVALDLMAALVLMVVQVVQEAVLVIQVHRHIQAEQQEVELLIKVLPVELPLLAVKMLAVAVVEQEQ
jgi:hypothetical protein